MEEPMYVIPEDMPMYKDTYASLVQTHGAWVHMTNSMVCADLFCTRNVVEMFVYRLEYRYDRGDFDHMLVLGQNFVSYCLLVEVALTRRQYPSRRPRRAPSPHLSRSLSHRQWVHISDLRALQNRHQQ